MGSLPNLHELSKTDRAPVFLKPSLQTRTLHSQAKATGCTPACGVTRTRKVQRTRSTGNPHHLWDDVMMEHMASYSPISSRSSRNLALQCAIRRRDSMGSSIGATSVRRLIAVVRNTSGKNGPVYSKQILLKNYTILCVGHSLISASMFPLLALQGSISTWYWPHASKLGLLEFYVGNNSGSILLALLFIIATFSSFLSQFLIQKLGPLSIFITGYAIFAVFFAAHLYPILHVLIPVYVILGITLPVFSVCKISFLMTLANKLSCVLTDCEEDEHKLHCTCEVVIRRLARGLQAAQDFGLVMGSLIVGLLISYTAVNTSEHSRIAYTYSVADGTVLNTPSSLDYINSTTNFNKSEFSSFTNVVPTNLTEISNKSDLMINEHQDKEFYISLSYLDDIFSTDETGERICGANACPTYYIIQFNTTNEERQWRDSRTIPQTTAGVIAGIFVGFGVIALATSVFMEKIRIPPEPSDRLGGLRNFKDTLTNARLQLAAPLAVFIGLEQAFIFSDFTKSYVSCALGPQGICLAVFALGLLQSIAACTLSMLLRHVKRLVVIVAGFTFHACLLLALARWKPSAEDSALFYVIAASWGVCNAVWEILNFALLSQTLNTICCWSHSLAFRQLGLCIGFALHGVICEKYKLLGLAAGLVLSIPPYAYLERKCEKDRNARHLINL